MSTATEYRNCSRLTKQRRAAARRLSDAQIESLRRAVAAITATEAVILDDLVERERPTDSLGIVLRAIGNVVDRESEARP